MRLQIDGRTGWKAKVPGRPARAGTFADTFASDPGEDIPITFKRRQGGTVERFHVRCLPVDFPEYRFKRISPGGAKLFMVHLPDQYAAVFDDDGVPVWWAHADGVPLDAKILPDGTISWDTVSATTGTATGAFDITSLDGSFVRTVGNDESTDVHDLQVLPNGDYVIARQEHRTGVDTTAFGGSASAALLDYVIEQVTPEGQVIRSWSTAEHIGLEETGRWWPSITDNWIYDIAHWNAVEIDGGYMYLSFRHLDAIYKVDRRTGEIVWKLGGTETPESLEVLNDPRDYPIGGQHDVRVQPNGTVTIHNNRTGLEDAVPRAERYRINENKGTATLVESITDKKVPEATCCGSARRLADGTWLAAWGRNEIVGAYDADGNPLYRFRIPGTFTYRANTVPDGISRRDLRAGMDRMNP